METDDDDSETAGEPVKVDVVWDGGDTVKVAFPARSGNGRGSRSATGADERVAGMVETALDHDRLLREVARRAGVDTDSLLALLRCELDAAVPAADASTAFSEPERRVLVDAGVDLSGPDVGHEDPAAATAARFAAVVGSASTVAQVAARIGVSAGRVRQRIADRSLHAVRLGAGEWRLPEWQFTSTGVVPGLEVVLPRMPEELHPMAIKGFMAHANPDLVVDGEAVSPVEWLSTGGDPARVAEQADSLLFFA